MSGKSLPISTRIKTIEEKLAGRLTRITKERCMYKVHEQLHDVKEKAYKPVLLAIGPYNDQDEVGKGFVKEHKLRYLQQTLKGTKRSECIKALIGLEKRAHKCYAECISKSLDDDFVEMMLLDGCFIIELFRKYKKRDEDEDQTDEGDSIIRAEQSLEYEAQDPTDGSDPSTDSEQSPEYDPIFHMAWVLPLIARDLLLFGNQLPYFVLVKLFEIMSESNETRPRTGSRSSGEHIVSVEEKEEINDLALGFDFLPFQLDIDASSYYSTKTIRHLLRLTTHDQALTPELPILVWNRLEIGNKTSRAGVKSKKAEIYEHLENTSKENSSANESQSEGWKSIILGPELRNAGVEFNLANQFMDKFLEIVDWREIEFYIELREAGIELKEAKAFNDLLRARKRNENQESKCCEPEAQGDGVESKTAEKFKRLLCLNKNEDWNSIPHGKELRDARVKLKKAKKFKSLHALKEIEHWNIYGATELKEAGITFKAAKEDDWPFSIKFNNGLMEISPISIQDHTEDYLRNLIAYEQYCDKDSGLNYVNDYVHFMDGLINTPKDVELLHREGIIRNYLGDDEVISNMVNKLGDNINISTSNSIYARTAMDVNRYCRTKMHVWMAMLRHDYLNSPWAWISILAAVFLLGLAIVQTVFSIIQS